MTRHAHVPDGWPAVIPRIFVDDPAALVTFIVDVFGAVGELQTTRPTELRIGNGLILVSGTTERPAASAVLYVYVPDVDDVYRRALDSGATSDEAPTDLPYGDRRAMVTDRWGNVWQIATHTGRFTPGS